MPQVGDAFIEFRARTDKMAADLKEGTTSAAGEMVKNMAIGGLAVEAVVKSVDYLKDAWKNAADAAKGERQTEAVLRSTGEAAGVTADHVTELAKALQKKSTVDDDVVRSSENVLLTFAHLRNETGKGNDVFDRTTALTLDMAAAMGTSATAAAMKLGRALDSPVEGTAALVKQGVRFTEQQKEQIAAMVASGNTLGAQTLMLAEYEKRFGGSAAAQATSADRAKIALENMSEAIGTAVIPVVETAAKVVAFLAEGMQELPGPVLTAGVVIVGLGAAAVAASKAVTLFGEVTGALGPILGAATGSTARKAAADAVLAEAATAAAAAESALVVAQEASAGAAGAAVVGQEALAVAETEAAVAAEAEGAAMSMAIPVIGLLIAAAAVGIAVWHRSAAAKEEMRKAVKAVEGALYDEHGALKENVDVWNTYITTQSKFKNNDTQAALLAIGDSLGSLRTQVEGGKQGLLEFELAEKAARDAGQLTMDQVFDLEGAFRKEAKAQEEAAKQKLNAAVLAGKLTKEQVEEAVATASATDKTNAHIVAMKQLSPAIEAAASASKNLVAEVGPLKFEFGYVADNAKDAAAALDTFNRHSGDAGWSLGGAATAAETFAKQTDFAAKSAGGGGGAMKDMAAEADKLAKAEAGVVTAEEDLALAVEKRILIQAGPTKNQVAIAQIEARQRTRELTAATNEAADAEKALQEAQKSNTGPAIAHASELAIREVAAADRDVVRATLAVEDAQKRLTAAEAAGDPEGITKARLDLADAQDRVVGKTDAAKLAHDHLKSAQELQEGAARKVKDAADKLEGAQDHVTKSAMATEDAQKNLTATNNIGKDGSKELKDAVDAVEAAQRKVAEAHDAVRKQEDAMNTSRTGGGGSIAVTHTLAEETDAVYKAGDTWMQSIIVHKGTRQQVDDAYKAISERIDGIKDASPLAKEAMHTWLDGAKFDAEAALIPIEAMKKAAEDLKRTLEEGNQIAIEIGLGIKPTVFPAHARGGNAHRGLALVGEEGPELVQFGGDAAVFPNDQLMAALGNNNGGGDTIVINIGTVTGTRNDAEMVGNVASAHVARTLAGVRARFDLRGNR